jgi:hypothetical protein
MDLTRKRERDRLSVRREPYWHRLRKGAALGFRRGPDTWVLRYTDRASGKTKYVALEDDNLDFDQAKEKAETELGYRTKSAVRIVKRQTVRRHRHVSSSSDQSEGRDCLPMPAIRPG